MKNLKDLIVDEINKSTDISGSIFEWLEPFNLPDVIHMLRKQYKNDSIGITKHPGLDDDFENHDIAIISVPKQLINSVQKRLDFEMLLDSIHWFVTRDEQSNDTYFRLLIEKNKSKNISDWVCKHKYIYHITTDQKIHIDTPTGIKNTMLEIGMRPRAGSSYRKFPARSYFIAGGSWELPDIVWGVADSLNISGKDIKIFRIETKHLKNINFYRDPLYDKNNCFYAHVQIPWKYMEEVTIKEIYND